MRTTRLAGIVICSPVRGLRRSQAGRSEVLIDISPVSRTLSPAASAALNTGVSAASTASASAAVTPDG
jgi:hypothetical protein